MTSFTLPFELDSVSSYFGPRLIVEASGELVDPWDEITALNAVWQSHDGIDYRADEGTEVLSPADGVVSLVTDDDAPAGFSIHVQHGTGAVMSISAHLMGKPNFQFGDVVKAGDVIGHVGSTGNSTGPHLHFSTLVRGIPYNPLTISTKWTHYNSVDWDSTANTQEEINGGN